MFFLSNSFPENHSGHELINQFNLVKNRIPDIYQQNIKIEEINPKLNEISILRSDIIFNHFKNYSDFLPFVIEKIDATDNKRKKLSEKLVQIETDRKSVDDKIYITTIQTSYNIIDRIEFFRNLKF